MARLKHHRRWLHWLLPSLTLAGLGFALASDFSTQLRTPLVISQPVRLELSSGESFSAVLDDLARRGELAGLRQRFYLQLYARVTGQGRKIKTGEYRLNPGLTARSLLALLVSGKVMLHELRLTEGWRLAQALAAVRADPALKHVLPPGATAATLMGALGYPQQPAEGQFFPDTYYFPKGETDVAFLRRAYQAMRQHLATVWSTRAAGLPYKTPEDALILASLVEKETALPHERPMIAGVFVHRLELGMRLQTDPSVIYGLGETYDGHLHRSNLTTDTPYNTYMRDGLPPTPICLPGTASLQAATHPAAGDALYFVAKGDGSHEFSATLAEHDAAVRRFQLHKKP
ncbi:MAG: endolytic transglycosylase MltG [Gammaproteobacteria bacterium]|nr:endolytic transglycosylase MltG [Gammaproteobacteria bacterium]